VNASPLLKEKGNLVRAALLANSLYPLASDWASPGAAFSSNYHPIDVAQVKLPQVFEQGFN
jgi:hypothetical protein